MARKNKHYKREKRAIKLHQLNNENWEAQRNLGYKPLDKLIPHGYIARYKLRDDISRRDDAYILQYIIDNYSGSVWCKNEKFEVKNRSCKGGLQPIRPGIESVREDYYNQMDQRVQKWFSDRVFVYWDKKHLDLGALNTDRWGWKWYHCTIPKFFLELDIKRDYKTHYKVIDEILQQEEAEISDELWNLQYKGYSIWRYNSPPRDTRRFYHKSRRQEEKALLRKIKAGYHDPEDVIFPGQDRHSAKWDWW